MTESGSGLVLRRIVGQRLAAVIFIEDYLQLQFDDACLSAYTPPEVLASEHRLSSSDHQYRNVLCELIGKKVSTVYEEPEAFIRISFEQAVTLTISLKEEDRTCAEAAALQVGDGSWWDVW